MVGFYRQFIPQCAEITRPLIQLLRKGVKWRWEEEQQNVFLQLSRAIADTASLKLPDLNRPFVLQTDASGYGLGAVLLQEFDGVLRPVAFASHTLTPAQRNQNVCELECIAIIFALKKFSIYLDGARFVIQSDNTALSWLQSLKKPACRPARWALTLQKYDYRIVHKPATQNKVADALSRAPLAEQHVHEFANIVAAADKISRWGNSDQPSRPSGSATER